LYKSPNSQYNPGIEGNKLKIWEYKSEEILPQFKVRTHEIATCKSLILCKKDPWNLIEDFYEPNKDFIYFDNLSELEDILHDVNTNFEKYVPIIESAYQTVQKYSVENFFEFVKTKDKNLINWKNKNYGIL
jgi:spore maturation protein CgeB